jgi:hypothetical protein
MSPWGVPTALLWMLSASSCVSWPVRLVTVLLLDVLDIVADAVTATAIGARRDVNSGEKITSHSPWRLG